MLSRRVGQQTFFPSFALAGQPPYPLTRVPWGRKGTAAGVPLLALEWEHGQGENKKVAFARQTYP
jgi:hypothetical protein